MATTIRERMLARLKRPKSVRGQLKIRDLSELGPTEVSGEPIWSLAYYHRIVLKTHLGFVEVTPARETVALDSSKSFDVTLTSGVRLAVAPGFDAAELARLIATLDARC
jgi:hypothetical protein